MPIQSTVSFRSREGEPLQWREVYWSDGDDPVLTVATWQSVVGGTSLLTLRAQSLSNSAQISALKCTFFAPGQPKVTKSIRFFPAIVGRAESADYCGLGVSFALESQGKRRSVSFRGIPDIWVAGNELSAEGNAGVQRILSGVVQANGKIQGRGKGFFAVMSERLGLSIYALNVPQLYPVTSVSKGATDNLIRLTVADDALAAINVGTVVTVTNAASMPLLRGPWKVAVKSADPPFVALAGSQQLAAIAGTTALVRPQGKALYGEGLQVSPVGLRTRDTGRPTTGPRGRRPARIRRR